MKRKILIAALVLLGLFSYGQNKKTLADSLYHHDNGEKIYLKTEIDSVPKYPNGDNEIFNFMAKNIVYPQDAKENEIHGTVYLSFVVEKNGSISDVIIIKGVNESLDKEALRVGKILPNGWTPALKNGQVVRFQYILPVKFKLAGVKEKKKKK